MAELTAIREIIARMTGRTIGELTSSNCDVEELKRSLMRSSAENYNSQSGKLTGYDCPKCKNRGEFMLYDEENNTTAIRDCECLEVRRRIAMIEASGLGEKLKNNTFARFKAEEAWQKSIKKQAMRYLGDCTGNWYYIGGQVGCGKTHICTAIAGELLRRGYPTRYMLWRDDAVRIKQLLKDEEEYARQVGDLKTVKVLYIDDFFKVKQGEKPTAGDVNLAFEILNYRYNDPQLITIISSEYGTRELLKTDEAVGSRIYERSRKYNVCIGADRRKNQRTKDLRVSEIARTPVAADDNAGYWWQV